MTANVCEANKSSERTIKNSITKMNQREKGFSFSDLQRKQHNDKISNNCNCVVGDRLRFHSSYVSRLACTVTLVLRRAQCVQHAPTSHASFLRGLKYWLPQGPCLQRNKNNTGTCVHMYVKLWWIAAQHADHNGGNSVHQHSFLKMISNDASHHRGPCLPWTDDTLIAVYFLIPSSSLCSTLTAFFLVNTAA